MFYLNWKKDKNLVKIPECLLHYFVILETLCACMLYMLVYNSKCVSWKKYQFSWIMKYLGVVVWQLWWNPVLEEKDDDFIFFLVIIERLVIIMKLWTLAFFSKTKNSNVRQTQSWLKIWHEFKKEFQNSRKCVSVFKIFAPPLNSTKKAQVKSCALYVFFYTIWKNYC